MFILVLLATNVWCVQHKITESDNSLILHSLRDEVQSFGEIRYLEFIQDSSTPSPLSILNLNEFKVANFTETLGLVP